jgi:hypothetical protein
VYGSHDRFGGERFCLGDYVCYSADVKDLTDWRYEGVIYEKTQDLRTADGTYELWAPDVVKGKDGRYYLYYCPDDRIRSIGVAVCDTPAGKYEFLGVVKDKNGQFIGERPGDTIQFDPGVFIDDDIIYLYSGNGPRTKEDIGKEPKASVVMTLEDDMVTIKTEPKKLLPILGEEAGTGFEGHAFFEASSIRVINKKYYLVYSSVNLHELCYAVSDCPDGGYNYGGTIISHCDIFPDTTRDSPTNCFGNNHGGIECINGDWYVFYHRQTNGTMFSRQGCAEKIIVLEDGSIPQVEVTSCGLNSGPLQGRGTYPASIACYLRGNEVPTITHPLAMRGMHPYITQDKPDYDPDSGQDVPKQFITNCENGMTAGFRYFDIDKLSNIAVTIRGTAKGMFEVKTEPDGKSHGLLSVSPSEQWQTFNGSVSIPPGTHALYFRFIGSGRLDFLEFTLE